MPEDETTDLGIEGNLSSLRGSAVEGLLGEEGVLGGKGGFVIEAGDATKKFGELGTVGGVRTVRIGTDRVGGCGEPLVGNEVAVRSGPVHPCLDVVDL